MYPHVLWIDRDHARLFRVSAQGIRRSRVDKTLNLHHTPADPVKKRKDSKPFFHEVAEAVQDASEILVLGPGLAKRHFVAHLARHHEGLRKRVVGVETMAQATPERVLAASRRFFRAFDRFEHPA